MNRTEALEILVDEMVYVGSGITRKQAKGIKRMLRGDGKILKSSKPNKYDPGLSFLKPKKTDYPELYYGKRDNGVYELQITTEYGSLRGRVFDTRVGGVSQKYREVEKATKSQFAYEEKQDEPWQRVFASGEHFVKSRQEDRSILLISETLDVFD